MEKTLKGLFLKKVENRKKENMLKVVFSFSFSIFSYFLPRIGKAGFTHFFATLRGEEIDLHYFGGRVCCKEFCNTGGSDFIITAKRAYSIYAPFDEEYRALYGEYPEPEERGVKWTEDLARLIGEAFNLSSLELSLGEAYSELRKKIEQ